jgi:hypothetical protein
VLITVSSGHATDERLSLQESQWQCWSRDFPCLGGLAPDCWAISGTTQGITAISPCFGWCLFLWLLRPDRWLFSLFWRSEREVWWSFDPALVHLGNLRRHKGPAGKLGLIACRHTTRLSIAIVGPIGVADHHDHSGIGHLEDVQL